MNTVKAKPLSQPALQLVDAEYLAKECLIDDAAVAAPVAPDLSGPLGHVLAQLRQGARLGSDDAGLLEQALLDERDTDRLWALVSALELAPPKTVSVSAVYDALCRLVEADSPVIRQSAYRGLTRLHQIDLRFENRARLRLGECLKRERGVMRQRIKRLLQLC
jgi:hypothetical protein